MKGDPRKPTKRLVSCEKKWLTVKELTAYLGFGSDNKQREWRENNLLPYYFVRGTICYNIKDVDAFMEKHRIVL